MVKDVKSASDDATKQLSSKERLSSDLVSSLPSFAFDDNDNLLDCGFWYLNKQCSVSMRDIGDALDIKGSTVQYHCAKFGDRYNDEDNTDDDVVAMRQEIGRRQMQVAVSQANLSNGDLRERIEQQAELKKLQAVESAGNEQARSIAVSLQLITYDSYLSLFGDTPYFEQREGCPDVWYDAFTRAFEGKAYNYRRALDGHYTPHYDAFDAIIKYMQDIMTSTQRKSIKIACALHNLDTKDLRDIVNDDLNPRYRRLYAERDDNNEIHILLKNQNDPNIVSDITDFEFPLHNGTVNGCTAITPLDVLEVNDKTLTITPIDVCYDNTRTSLYRWKMPHVHLTAWAPSGISIRRWGKFMGLLNPNDYHFIDKLQGRHKNSADGARFSFNAMIGYLAHMTVQARMDGKHEYTDWTDRTRHSDTVDMRSIMNGNLEKFNQDLMEDLQNIDIPGLVDMCISGKVDINTIYDPHSILYRRLTDSKGTASNRVRSEFLDQYNKAKWATNPGIDRVLYVWGSIGGIGKTTVAREELNPGIDPADPTNHDVILTKSGNSNSTAGMLENYTCESCVLFDEFRPSSVMSGFGSVDNMLMFFDPHRHDVGVVKARQHDTIVSASKFAFANTTDPYEFFTYVKNHGHEVGSDTQWLRRLSDIEFVSSDDVDDEYATVRHMSHLLAFSASDFESMYMLDRKTNQRVDLNRGRYLFNQFCNNHDLGNGDVLLDQLRELSKSNDADFTIDDDLTFYGNFDRNYNPFGARFNSILARNYYQDPDDPLGSFVFYAMKYGVNKWRAIDPNAKLHHRVRFEEDSYARWLQSCFNSPRYELYGSFDGVKRRICTDPNDLHVGDVYVHTLGTRDLEYWGGTYQDYDFYRSNSNEYKGGWSLGQHDNLRKEVETAVRHADPIKTPLAYVFNRVGFLCDEMWRQHSACDGVAYPERVRKIDDQRLN